METSRNSTLKWLANWEQLYVICNLVLLIYPFLVGVVLLILYLAKGITCFEASNYIVLLSGIYYLFVHTLIGCAWSIIVLGKLLKAWIMWIVDLVLISFEIIWWFVATIIFVLNDNSGCISSSANAIWGGHLLVVIHIWFLVLRAVLTIFFLIVWSISGPLPNSSNEETLPDIP